MLSCLLAHVYRSESAVWASCKVGGREGNRTPNPLQGNALVVRFLVHSVLYQ